MATYIALFDACVLYPAPLRDLLMHMAKTDLFRAKWSDLIHDEWTAAVLRTRPELHDRLVRTRELMNKAIPDATVTGFELLIDTLTLPDPNDRHVLAAAITSHADVIVTANLKDFPSEALDPYGIEARHPDDFIVSQFDLDPALVLGEIRNLRAALINPPKSVDELLQTYTVLGLPQIVRRLRACSGAI